MVKGFWADLKRPIIGLAPMDGVTDAAFRYITDIHGHPDILVTEFTSAEGIVRGADTLLEAFIHHDTKTPTVAQIFGNDPDAFYRTSFVLGEMGFDGIDINMGCPDKNVSKKGAGAGLILQPKRAQEIVRAVKQGMKEWAAGRTLEDIGLPDSIVAYVNEYKKHHPTVVRRELPVSVKTRIGFDAIVTRDWISNLLETEPATITVHGRTLKQLYGGFADWDEIAVAADLAHRTETLLLGNGDIKSLEDARSRIATYKTDGVLIGRAAFGNPWIFTDTPADPKTRLLTAIEHCHAFETLTPNLHFLTLRKHITWYCKGFPHAHESRAKLMQATDALQVEAIIKEMVTG